MGPRPLHELSLFSGYGGFSLGLRLAGLDVRTVCYVEREPYAQAVIRARIADGHLDDAPLWDDVRTFDGGPWSGAVDIVTAGFPCQPHSIAGRRAGDADERNLWPDTLRVVREVRPHYVLLENAGIDLRDGVAPAYAYTVLADLAGIGYDARWASVPAAAVGAPHLRWRWWCLAYSGGVAAPTEPLPEPRSNGAPEPGRHGEAGTLAHPDRGGQRTQLGNVHEGQSYVAGSGQEGLVAHAEGERWGEGAGPRPRGGGPPCTRAPNDGWWEVEPALGRVVDGYSHRVDELRSLGNGVVPAVVARFLRGR